MEYCYISCKAYEGVIQKLQGSEAMSSVAWMSICDMVVQREKGIFTEDSYSPTSYRDVKKIPASSSFCSGTVVSALIHLVARAG